jgi:hypothetical protein
MRTTIMRSALGPNVRLLGFFLPIVIALAGCNSATITPLVDPTSHVIHGNVHGGQQPLVGASIQLYAAGDPSTGGGYGVGSTPLIVGPLPTTDNNGNFTITGTYVLPTTPSHLYIVAIGVSSGAGSPVNNQSALMAVIDGCNGVTSLSPLLFITINEVTTVASTLALQPFMAAPALGNTGAPAIGAPATAHNALQNAFATANNLASPYTGVSLTHQQNYATTDNNALVVNTLGDILAYCVNSNPSTTTQCSNLFANATPSSASFIAQDTIQAAWYVAQNPTNNVPSLFNLAAASAPFVGLTSVPPGFNVTVATSASACQSPVPLGAAGNYAVLGGSTVTNSSTASDQTTVVGGLIGVSPGTATTGFVTGTYVGVIDNSGAAAAEGDLTTAYNTAAGLLSPAVLPSDLSGLTFTPGLYNTASTVTLNSGSVTLDAQGDPNAVFVFQIGSTFTAASGTQVILINGASAKNVFWQVGSSATINGSSAWAGNVIALASISMGTDATLLGRAMARNGAVTLLSNKISVP